MIGGSYRQWARDVLPHLFLGATFVAFVACGGGTSSTGSGGGTSSSSSGGTTTTDTGGGGAGGSGSAGGSGGQGGNGAGGSLGGFACSGASPAFSTVVMPLLQGCSGAEGCHQLSIGNPNVSYGYLVDQPTMECADGRKRVAPGDPAHSYIIDKLTNHDVCSGQPMPLIGPPLPSAPKTWNPLSSDDIQTVYDWICQGAKND